MQDDVPAYVSLISAELIRVKMNSEVVTDILRKVGFQYSSDWNEWYTNVPEEDKPKLFELLRDHNIAFSDGPAGWPPAAVFEYLREQGKISGEYTSIVWIGKRKYRVVQK